MQEIPVHFRVDKSGPDKGAVTAIMLNIDAGHLSTSDNDPHFATVKLITTTRKATTTRDTSAPRSEIRLNTKHAKPEQYAPLLALLQKRFSGAVVKAYPKLTRSFLTKRQATLTSC